jgi:AraC family transcriptional regulator, transcriptional activator of the genes for pyochelin and ferripyochelin receptors
MSITLSQLDYQELWQQNCAAPPTGISENLDRIEVCPTQLGTGFIQTVPLRGMQLCIFNYEVHKDIIVNCEDGNYEWEIGFHLSGTRSGKRIGENFLSWGLWDEGQYEILAGEQIRKVDIHLDSPDLLQSFMGPLCDRLPAGLLQLLESPESEAYGNVDWITPAMRMALEQILTCPFQGLTRQLYLEGKCLELIALKFEQLTPHNSELTPAKLLKAEDIDRIHRAKAILINNLNHPPSLIELARQVELNDYKLKLGFRQVFGTTAFGCLHHYRMERAQQLLADRQMKVADVAQAVGYANQSHFARAFRKHFGMNPKSYLAGKNPSEAQKKSV